MMTAIGHLETHGYITSLKSSAGDTNTKSWLIASGIAGHPQGNDLTRLSIFNRA
ncbi:hypothetical protein [Leptothoe spongobia]|uniref:Uncharacterized protein n=1 Tax=Leptothoe spongobia TAU-MAC 1115 TaxID=1967444 RepID=A0A947DIG6_9CYAN|nr:hypothetical protein [Leptothoe spongobia]MBT9317567.1 hypothetical protein [Leptothoe spongobia TAU-MAC 1115]